MSSPPRAQRLSLPREFSRVLADGRRYRGSICTIIVLPCDAEPARLGLAISRKAAARAVRRNRIKRLAREVFREAAPNSGCFVVMARPGAGDSSDERIRDDLTQLWRRLRTGSPSCFSVSSVSTNG